ncbi:MAG: hypothetical protein JJ966_13420 [Balneolaceae bacterium]|nr:hypothetical protein [Balneolaceae bacterium]
MIRHFFTFIFLFIFSALVQAQDNNVTANINIEANVIQSIELITVNSMTFGNTQPGQEVIYVNPITDLNAGYMIAYGTPGAEFRLDYELNRQLTRIEGEGFLNFRYELSANSIEDQTSSELIEYENRNLRFNSEGIYYIWVGGEVNLENARPGNYEGDFTIEIDYI